MNIYAQDSFQCIQLGKESLDFGSAMNGFQGECSVLSPSTDIPFFLPVVVVVVRLYNIVDCNVLHQTLKRLWQKHPF